MLKLEDEVAPCEAQKESWETNLKVMAAKERQYNQQCDNYKVWCLFFSSLWGEGCSINKIFEVRYMLGMYMIYWVGCGFIFSTQEI